MANAGTEPPPIDGNSSVGRDREAVSLALTALAPHLTRYNRSLTAYASELG